MASITCAFSCSTTKCVLQKPPTSPLRRLNSSSSSTFKNPFSGDLRQVFEGNPVVGAMKMAYQNILESIADSMFKFIDQPASDPALGFLQGNFAPVDEIGEAVAISVTEGELPEDFPEGVYIRNGPNPYFPDKITAHSRLGEVHFDWFQGDGMVHATYFRKVDEEEGRWRLSYKNRYMESETFLMEKEKNRPLFIPSVLGQPPAVLAAIILNMLRLGKSSKDSNSTNVFEHAGRAFAITESHLPHEIDISNLETKGEWDVDGAWNRPFTSHPKKAPGSGELVVMGVHVNKPYYVLGVISADGKKMIHKADMKFKKATLSHELGVTENYNIIMDYPQRFGVERLLNDKSFFGYEPNELSRIGVMPRYGDAESITWFHVENHCTFHIINSFEDEDEVIIRGCRASGSVLPGPDHKIGDKVEWYKRAYVKPASKDSEVFDPHIDGVLFSRPYEWRLNMKNGGVKEGYLTNPGIAMEFPTSNTNTLGKKNKYAYAQVVDSERSADIGVPIFNMYAKLYFDERGNEGTIRVEYHVLEDNVFCSGLQFVEKTGSTQEDDGWLLCYVHNETTNVSQVHIVDANKFTLEPIAKITLPRRVPYGFHGTFISK